jgi:hypothetical protein
LAQVRKNNLGVVYITMFGGQQQLGGRRRRRATSKAGRKSRRTRRRHSRRMPFSRSFFRFGGQQQKF